jgi:hypothetical protein
VRRLPPALAAAATPRILELLVEPDAAQAERARERGALVVERSKGRFDAAVVPTGADLVGVDVARIIFVDERGHASMSG